MIPVTLREMTRIDIPVVQVFLVKDLEFVLQRGQGNTARRSGHL